VAIVLFSGRQMQVDLSSTGDTSQLRIQYWAQGFEVFAKSPLFGIGMGEFSEQLGVEAHNSFVHSYVELGFLGGTLFSGIFYTCVSGLVRLGRQDVVFYDLEAPRLRPYILGMISAYWVGLFSLSRSYTVPTYMVFGIVSVYLQNAGARTSEGASRFDATFVMRLQKFSVVWLIFLIVFTKLMVRW
jgi:putative inorganic carbon (hco3(-)) transporter